MSANLYQKCEHCKGTGLVRGSEPGLMIGCSGCNRTGFWQVGLTMGQVEKIIAECDRLLEFVARVAELKFNDEIAELLEEGQKLVEGRGGIVWEYRRKQQEAKGKPQ